MTGLVPVIHAVGRVALHPNEERTARLRTIAAQSRWDGRGEPGQDG